MSLMEETERLSREIRSIKLILFSLVILMLVLIGLQFTSVTKEPETSSTVTNEGGQGGNSTVYVSDGKPTPGAFRDWFTTEEAAEIAGVSERHMRDLCAEGKIDGAAKIEGVWQIPKSALDSQ